MFFPFWFFWTSELILLKIVSIFSTKLKEKWKFYFPHSSQPALVIPQKDCALCFYDVSASFIVFSALHFADGMTQKAQSCVHTDNDYAYIICETNIHGCIKFGQAES